MHRGGDSQRTAGEDMIVDGFPETQGTVELRVDQLFSIPALSKGKRIGSMKCRVKRLSKVLVMCQASALLLLERGNV